MVPTAVSMIGKGHEATLRCDSRLHHIGLGARQSVLLFVADRDVRIVDADGGLLRELVLDPTRDYQRQSAWVYDRANRSPMSRHITSAEGVGFEPTEALRLQRFSRPPHSTALPPLPANKHRASGTICSRAEIHLMPILMPTSVPDGSARCIEASASRDPLPSGLHARLRASAYTITSVRGRTRRAGAHAGNIPAAISQTCTTMLAT
jgi:hypothetical protein